MSRAHWSATVLADRVQASMKQITRVVRLVMMMMMMMMMMM